LLKCLIELREYIILINADHREEDPARILDALSGR
jgi:hypothetical protein